MKVDNPEFDETGEVVWCKECPFADKHGVLMDHLVGKGVACSAGCPTTADYQGRCRLAEQANKGERG